ncbi:MAG: DinB family protein [Candidatus Heimdallarchaeota archaeon]|nr:MAG: DinB family protein [Candidatus Heimdallarchaeota archaeon]
MSKLELIKQLLEYTLDHPMKTLDKAILLIPSNKLDWKPCDDTMKAADLGIHVYRSSLVYMAGTLKGEFTDADYSIIPFDSKVVKSPSEITEYGEKVKSYIRENLSKLTEADLDKKVTYSCWGGFKLGELASLATIPEETIHHRGQLCVYLRMLGIKPPFIYETE